MINGELKSFSAADCYNTSLSLIPAYPTSHITMGSQDWDGDTTLSASGFSGVQMNTVYNVTANPHSVALADHNLAMPDPLINSFELETCDNFVESSQLPFGWPQESSGNNMLNSFVPLNHWIPKEEPVSSETCMNMDWKEAELQRSVHTVNLNDTNEFQSSFKGEEDTSYSAPKPLRSMCKKTKKRSEADSRRRTIIAQKVKALKELLPGTLKGSRGNQESIVHDFTSYIKYLQLQLKELSRNRLGGESGSSPLRFIEGYGHYHPDAQKFDESLEEIFGSLFEENPAAAQEILKNNGLYTVPVTSFEAFLCKR